MPRRVISSSASKPLASGGRQNGAAVMIAATLRRMGFDYVFDTQFSAESWIRALPDDQIVDFLGHEVFIRMWGDPAVDDPLAAL